MNSVLQRTTFRTSREMDFFSERELVTQTGHGKHEWPLVIMKEVCDNSLDACEEADIAPVIHIAADPTGITVRDNGPGLPEATLQATLDFRVRVSNREAYVSPCRGAQGNALKTLLPMPYVLDPDEGKFIVTAQGVTHEITCRVDPISQRPVIHDESSKSKNLQIGEGEKSLLYSSAATHEKDGKSKNLHYEDKKSKLYSGTEVRLEWGARFDLPEALSGGSPLWPFSESPCVWLGPKNVFLPGTENLRKNVYALVEGFALFNPHTTISLDWFGQTITWEATDPDWKKWKPNQPTSAHWYERRHLERLIGAYITDERDKGAKESRLVSEFLAEFDGLSGSAKQSKVLNAAGLKRCRLTDFVVGDRLDNARIATLLDAMKKNTKPVNPTRLGLIGEAHLKERLLRMGVVETSFTYANQLGKNPNLPWVLECAFGWLGPKAIEERKIAAGANWSAAISNPFRSFGSTREGLESLLADARAKRNEPIVYVLHLACPRVEYTDRGKSALVLGE